MVTTTSDLPTTAAIVADLDPTPLANIPAATAFSTSGAPVQIVPDVDPSHPAVDNDPRKNTTVLQNKIDFNDPTVTGAEAVATALGMKTEADTTPAGKATAKS